MKRVGESLDSKTADEWITTIRSSLDRGIKKHRAAHSPPTRLNDSRCATKSAEKSRGDSFGKTMRWWLPALLTYCEGPPKKGEAGFDAALRVLVAIIPFADWKTGEAFPSLDTLARETRRSPNTVSRATATLASAGILTKRRRQRTSILYKLRFDSPLKA